MNFSRPFIERPIGTTLLAIGLFLIGAAAYVSLPVASLPSIEFPTINVVATLPGGDPETMAARVAAPSLRRNHPACVTGPLPPFPCRLRSFRRPSVRAGPGCGRANR